MIIEDDGTGMTRDQFLKRWMTLGYLRVDHQGEYAEFPPGIDGRRRAFGRNGLGRHALFCFNDEYFVETARDGEYWRYWLQSMSGEQPFAIVNEEQLAQNNFEHGTRLGVIVQRGLVPPDMAREVLGARFLYDPNFIVEINDKRISIMDLSAVVEQTTINIKGANIQITAIDSSRTAKRMVYHGVAFWVGGRLVGEPSWQVGVETILDGRTVPAKRFTVIVQCDDLFDFVLPDWSGFQLSTLVDKVQKTVAKYTREFIRRMRVDKAEEKIKEVIRHHRDEINSLDDLGKVEVSEFVSNVVENSPTTSADTLAVATEAVINLTKTQSGKSLLSKLSQLDVDDIEALNQLLNQWTARDALLVLREIDRRLSVIEALDKLINSSLRDSADELHTIHPLVTEARWLFGPQYESSEFTFNKTVHRALEDLFGRKIDRSVFANYKNRPDLLCIGDSTISAVAMERFGFEDVLVELEHILIIEVKRADKTIGRNEVNQASGYVEDLSASGVIDGRPRIDAFVVGERIDKNMLHARSRTIGDFGKVEMCTFDQLIRTANQRLFRLRDILRDHYSGVDAETLIDRVLTEPYQTSLEITEGS